MPDKHLPVPGTLDLAPEITSVLGLPSGRLSLRRSWPRDSEHLLLEYVDDRGDIIAGQWFAEPERLARIAKATARASRAPSLGLTELSLLLQAKGADRRLEALAPLLAQPDAALLVHRAERRAVVRLERAGKAPRYAKLVRPERTKTMLEANEAAATLGAGAFSTPRLLEADAETGVTVWSAVPGTPLHDLFGRPGLARAAAEMGRALRALHDTVPRRRPALHSPDEEAAWLETWLRRLRPYAPRLHEEACAIAPGVLAALSGSTSDPVLIHGDFHDKQVIVGDEDGIGLLDFDTLATGEAALDVANAIIHFELRALQGLCAPSQSSEASQAFLDGYGASSEVRRRLQPYADGTRLRLACLYAFRPRWRDQLPGELLQRIGLPAAPGAVAA